MIRDVDYQQILKTFSIRVTYAVSMESLIFFFWDEKQRIVKYVLTMGFFQTVRNL